MKRNFFERYAMFILMIAFFLVPLVMRGSRLAMREMRNDVKDWLPSSFEETTELEWFRDYFLGEAFVMLSWEGCTGTTDDERFRVFIDKFFPELPPSQRVDATVTQSGIGRRPEVDEKLGLYTRQMKASDFPEQDDFIGNKLGLFTQGGNFENWGGGQEKWLRGYHNQWYYVLPNGELYSWSGNATAPASLWRLFRRKVLKNFELKGQYIASLGEIDGPWYYRDPRRLEARLFKSVITGPSLLGDLLADEGVLDGMPEAAVDRLRGILIGPDGKQTCVLVSLSEAGKYDLHRLVGRGILGKPRGKLLQMADASGVYAPPRPSMLPPPLDKWFATPVGPTGPLLRIGGPPVDNVAIDEEGQVTLFRLIGLSLLVGLGFSYLTFRSVGVVLILFFVGAISAVASLSFVFWGGASMDAILMSMPSLVYVLGLSGAVHIVNYYRDATLASGGLETGPGQAVRMGWKPCTVAAFTTALGLVSLSTSNIVPIRKFGFFSAWGVLFTLLLLFTFLPAALYIWPPRFSRNDKTKDEPSAFHHWVTAFWKAIGRFVVQRNLLTTASMLVLLAVFGWGLTKINTSVQLLNLFHPSSKIIQDYTWLEENLGKLVPMELVVRVDPSVMRTGELEGDTRTADAEDRYRLTFLERMEITENIRRAVQSQFGEGKGDIVGRPMLAATFAPPMPKASSRSSTRRGVFTRQLANHRDEFLSSDYLRLENETGAELWRVSLRLGALRSVDYGQFVTELEKAVEPVMAAYRCRDVVLRSLDDLRKEGDFRGSSICILGAPFGPSPLTEKERFTEAEEIAKPGTSVDRVATETVGGVPLQDSVDEDADVAIERQVDQRAIFIGVLHSLLANADVKIRGWHDDRYPLIDDWESKLSDFDCVVVAGDNPAYDFTEMKTLGPMLIDARDFAFRPEKGDQIARKKGAPVSVVYTGLVPIIYKAQRTLLQSLIESIGWAFVAISIVMMLLLRSPSAGLISMIPNVFPVVLIFGFMGWRNILVDIGTMMTASVAMGVAVDDTIHFLTWFRQGINRGLDRLAAIELAYDRCATAMTQTTLIAGLGLSVFALSTFTPTQRFGILMLTLMIAALVGDLVFLPALLAGPLGKSFERRSKQKSQAGGTDQQAAKNPTAQAMETSNGQAARRGTSVVDAPASLSGPSASRRGAFESR